MKSTQTPPNKCILMDALYSQTTLEHLTSPTPTFNVMYRDAHVASVQIPPVVYGYFQAIAPQFSWALPDLSGFDPGNVPNGNTPLPAAVGVMGAAATGTPQSQNWASGVPVLTTLQAGAAGGAPQPNPNLQNFSLRFAVGLTNYVDLVETLGTGGNAATAPDGTAAPAGDPYYMMTSMRMLPPWPQE